MKTLKIASIIIFLFISCKKDKDTIISNQTFRAGVIDSINCYYKRFSPTLSFDYAICNDCPCINYTKDSLDIDNDNNYDLNIISSYSEQWNTAGLPGFITSFGAYIEVTNKSLSIAGPFKYGDTINVKSNWVSQNFELYSSSNMNYSNWRNNTGDHYLGYRFLIDKDTVYAWSHVETGGPTKVYNFQKDRK
jgi:hypothetical protein